MDWKAHLIGGTIFSLTFIFLMNFYFGWYSILPLSEASIILIIQILIIIPISSLVLDCDHRMGKLHNMILWVSGLISIIGVGILLLVKYNIVTTELWQPLLIFGVLIFTTTFFFAHYTSHRGFVHSVSFCLIFALLVYAITGFNYQLGILALIGCYSHLCLDKIPLKVK